MSNEHAFLSPSSLAEYLDVPLTTVYGWRQRGGGPPAVKVGKHLRYRRIDVEAWLAGLEAGHSTSEGTR